MRTMTRSAAALALVAAVGLAACGADAGSGDGDARAQTTSAPEAPATPGSAQPAPSARAAATGVKLTRVGTFDQPLGVVSAPGDRRRVYVVEQPGRVMVVRGGRKLARPFIDLRSRIRAGGEEGLLGLAFAPDFARSKRFYVHYSARSDGDTTIVEHRAATRDRAASGAGRLVLSTPTLESNHNGGQLAFGPDRLLYIGLGDGGGGGDPHGRRGNGQSLGTLLGKILRIDPSRRSGGRGYGIPSSNPFVGRAGARPEVYAYGLRNPWRFSFDRSTGDLSIADVGQDEIEEISFVRRGRGNGANFGWRPFEGSRRFAAGESAPGHVPPVLEKAHSAGWCSITGGYVVRDPRLRGLRGRYVYGDFCQGIIRSAQLRVPRARADRRVAGLPKVDSLSSFGQDAAGRIYVASLSGPVSRIDPR